MVLGLLCVGMAVGAATAGYWIFTGGSILIALALYSLVATAVVLGVAIVAFLVSERQLPGDAARPEAVAAE